MELAQGFANQSRSRRGLWGCNVPVQLSAWLFTYSTGDTPTPQNVSHSHMENCCTDALQLCTSYAK